MKASLDWKKGRLPNFLTRSNRKICELVPVFLDSQSVSRHSSTDHAMKIACSVYSLFSANFLFMFSGISWRIACIGKSWRRENEKKKKQTKINKDEEEKSKTKATKWKEGRRRKKRTKRRRRRKRTQGRGVERKAEENEKKADCLQQRFVLFSIMLLTMQDIWKMTEHTVNDTAHPATNQVRRNKTEHHVMIHLPFSLW